MAYIVEFKVSNLAGRKEDITRQLDRHVNVFWGLNGSGKTTLLKILHAALENDASALTDLPFQAADVIIVAASDVIITRSIRRRVSEAPLEGDDDERYYVEEDEDNDDEWTIATVVHNSDLRHGKSDPPSSADLVSMRPLMGRLEHTYLPITRVMGGRRTSWEAANVGRDIAVISSEEMFVRQVRRRWTEYSAKTLTLVRDIQQQGLATVLAILFGGARGGDERLPVLTSPQRAFQIVRSFLGQQDISLSVGRDAFIKRYKDSPDLQKVVEEIEVVRYLVDEASRPQIEFQSVIDKMYAGNKHLMFGPANGIRRVPNQIRVQVDDNFIPLKSLSSGEKQLLQILLETLAAEESTVMIDEPELSLHVDWQLALVEAMRRVNPGCQLLLATHSPEVMAEVNDEHVFRL